MLYFLSTRRPHKPERVFDIRPAPTKARAHYHASLFMQQLWWFMRPVLGLTTSHFNIGAEWLRQAREQQHQHTGSQQSSQQGGAACTAATAVADAR